MEAAMYIEEPVASLLDVGCNVGAWLSDCARRWPAARLAGVDINPVSIEIARGVLPNADLHCAGGEKLPFPDCTFAYVTCMEVIEHLPPELRAAAFQEMRRVLVPGGKLILSVPHKGWFAWMDSNNLRFRFPRLYHTVVRRGGRDETYAKKGRHVEWHEHFTLAELEQLAGPGWRRLGVRRGGLFLYPLMDLLSWPFYRMGKPYHPIRRGFERIAGWDYSIDFGSASAGILVALERETG